MNTRRRLIATSAALAAASVPLKSQAQACQPLFDRARYEKYLALYNALDPAFLDFYAEDVTMSLGPMQIKGRQAVFEAFKFARANTRETSEITFFASDANGMAVQLKGTFVALSDFSDIVSKGRAVRKGQVRHGSGVLLYTLDAAGRIKTIGGSAPEVVKDWH